MTILIVDDNHLVNHYFATYLRDRACFVISATDGIAALDWLDENPCDAVLLDVNMPGLDGITVLKLIREKFAYLPVVIFTAMGYDKEIMEQAKEAGANGYVSKTAGPSEVYAALSRCMMLSQKIA